MKDFIGMMIFIAGLGLLIATGIKHYSDWYLFLSIGAIYLGLDLFVKGKIEEHLDK